jgi:hypothetical protein
MTEAAQPPRDMIGFLDFYLVQKAPFQIPATGKELIVQWGPWIAVLLLILALPPLLFVLGVGTIMIPFGGVGYATNFTYLTLFLIIYLGLLIASLPGLFARKMSGWTLLFYAEIVGVVEGLLSGSIVGALIGGLIALYIVFQVRPLYKL